MPLKRIFILLAFLAAFTSAYAQGKVRPQNRPDYYSEKLHFGFFLGINKTNFVVTPVDTLKQVSDSLKTILSAPETGFNLGIVSELRLAEYLTLRFVPDLAFGQRNLEYHFEGTTDTFTIQKKIESTFLDFPLSLKLRSKRLGNFAAHMIGGGHYTLDLASQKDVQNNIPGQEVVKIRKHDFGVHAGAGVDFILPYFKFGIEFKAMLGTRNLLIRDETVYSRALDNLRSKVFLISLTFEG
ncbi:MAG: protein-translocating porin PorT [Bacteroidetes bacterium]|nr:MAG: protein-translocating porin PorT [Bacteroidota bacterium]